MRRLPVGPALLMGAVLSLFLTTPRAADPLIEPAGTERAKRQKRVAVDRPFLEQQLKDGSFDALLGPLAHERMPQATGPSLDEQLQRVSLATPFLAVGRLDVQGKGWCTATWLGENAGHTYVLTAAHCLSAQTAPAMRDHATFVGWNGSVLAKGWGWAFIPPEAVGDGRRADIALLRLPTLAIPKDREGERLMQPLLYDGQDESGWPLHLVGYGSSETWELQGEGQRRWGLAAPPIDSDGGRRLRTGFLADSPRKSDPEPLMDWARVASGDSGSGGWQAPRGYWSMAAVFSTATPGARDWGPMSSTSYGTRMSRFLPWAKDLYPGLATFSDRLTVTATTPFVSRNHALDVGKGTVYYTIPSQDGASGPTERLWSASQTHSTLRVLLTDELTGHRDEVRLRGWRDAGCGLKVRMEDGVGCVTDKRQGTLILSFHPEDNPGLKRGRYVGQFEVEAKGWHVPEYSERFTVRVKLNHHLEGSVSSSEPFISSLPTMLHPHFVVPSQERAVGSSAPTQQGDGEFSVIDLTVRDAVLQQDRRIKLRGQRVLACGRFGIPAVRRMEDSGPCGSAEPAASLLKVSFDPADNPGLRPGLYRGKLWIQAIQGTSEPELLQVDVNIETLFAGENLLSHLRGFVGFDPTRGTQPAHR